MQIRALLRVGEDYAAGGGNDEGIPHSIGVSSPKIMAAKLDLKGGETLSILF